MTPSSSWPAWFSLLAIALILHSFSVVNADDHLKPRSVWSRRHRNLEVARRQALPGGKPDSDSITDSQANTHLFDVGDPSEFDPVTLPSDPNNLTSDTSHSSVASTPSSDPSSGSSSSSGPSSSPSSSSSSSADSSSSTISSSSGDSGSGAVTSGSTDSSSSSSSSVEDGPILGGFFSFLKTSTTSTTSPTDATPDPLTPTSTVPSTAPVKEPTTESSQEPLVDPSTKTPTVAPTTAPSVEDSTEPSTSSTFSASSTQSAPDIAVITPTSSNSVSDPLIPDIPLLKGSTTSEQVSSVDPQESSTPTPTSKQVSSAESQESSTPIPTPVPFNSVDTGTTSSTTADNDLFPVIASLLPSVFDPPPSSSTTATSTEAPLATSPEATQSSSTGDSLLPTQNNDPRPSTSAEPPLLNPLLSDLLSPSSSSTTDSPLLNPILSDLLSSSSSSATDSPFPNLFPSPTSSSETDPPFFFPFPFPTSSSAAEPPISILPLPTSSTDDPLIGSPTIVPPSPSIDPPISPSATDFPTISSNSNGDGVITNQPPSRSTQPPIPSSSAGGSSILSLNMTSFLPGDPSTINTEDVSTVSMTESISVTIRPEFHYLTASSLNIEPVSTTSTSVTITNPDAPLSSATQTDGVLIETVSAVPIPTNLPQFIKPSDQSDPVDLNSKPPGFTLITILFQKEVGWTKVLSTSDIAGAMMAYIPALVTAILNAADQDVKLVGLKAYAGPDYQTSQNLDDVQTTLLFYLKNDQVQTLKSYYATSGSAFYTTGNTVTKQLTALVVKSFPLAAAFDLSGTQNAANTPPATTIDNGRRNAIIGVCATFGTIALGVFIWWMAKTRQRRQNVQNRLRYQQTPNYGTTGAPRVMEEQRNNGGLAGRRNSFYAFGQDNDTPEDDSFDYLSQHSHGGSGGHGNAVRRPVAGQPISQPILRETSMGQW